MPPKADWEKYKAGDQDQKEDTIKVLDAGDIQLLKTYGQGPYAQALKRIEKEIEDIRKRVNEQMGVKESETGLAPPNLWDIPADKQRMGEEHPLQVARCTKIIPGSISRAATAAAAQEAARASGAAQSNGDTSSPPPVPSSASPGAPTTNGTGTGAGAAGGLGALAGALGGGSDRRPNADEEDKYVINVKQVAKFVVGLGDKVASTDIEEGMRVGVTREKYQIQIPLPPKIDASVTMMQVEEKPDVTYSDVGGCKEQVEKLREVVETPLLHPERFVALGIDPPKGVLLFGPPGTGKTLCARAVANRTDATFIRVIGSELVQKYVGEGARMVRELFEMARSKKACIIFFDEIDAVGGARFDDGAGGDNEVQRTMLELINQLDGFDARGNIKVLMATNRPDTLDPALLRPGRIDRRVEFSLPDLEGRANILRIHARSMSVERGIRFDLIARLCPNSTGAELRSVCTEAGMYAIRSRRKVASEKDFLEAVEKVIRQGSKFSSSGLYQQYN
ncbi:MAG: 26S proteasome regulatory subunit 7 [Cyphobasidiales sp. Tagirdzhanova-0007]|nr:MAG: 26S proteasome regulatory subunit 7 [Cyphobasidiales sp. Tagirdzhanova-0007]